MLSNEEKEKISLGYRWNEGMSYEEFSEANPNLPMSKSYDVWSMIEQRYVDYKFEKN